MIGNRVAAEPAETIDQGLSSSSSRRNRSPCFYRRNRPPAFPVRTTRAYRLARSPARCRFFRQRPRCPPHLQPTEETSKMATLKLPPAFLFQAESRPPIHKRDSSPGNAVGKSSQETQLRRRCRNSP